jgi:hypothetical protein
MTFEASLAAISRFAPESELPFRLVTPPQWAARGVDPSAKLDAKAIPDWPAIESIRKVVLPVLVRPDPKNFGFEGKFEALAGSPARGEHMEPMKLRKTISVRAHRAKVKRAHTAMAR